MNLTMVGKRISEARKNCGMSQEEMAEKIGVTAQAVSKWENGHNFPDIENLMRIAEIANVPYSAILGTGDKCCENLNIRAKLFKEDNMFTRLRTMAAAEKLPETYRALNFMRECHVGQFRKKGRYSSEKVLYINHPLLMACHAHALGINDDVILAAVLLHDVLEDTDATAEELPFCEEVKELVTTLSFFKHGSKTKEEYYSDISKNGKVCVIKILDRCNNISTMAGSFTRHKMIEYIKETEKYILPLTDVLKYNYPEYDDIAFLVKYHIISVLETVKCLTV